MSKTKVFICVLSLAFALCGCDLYVYRQPDNYENSVWVCDEPKITYYVGGSLDDNSVPYAVANIDGRETMFSFWFRSSVVYIYERDENGLDSIDKFLIGNCRYTSEKFIVNISEDYDKLFAGQYKTLVFDRVK